MSDAPARRSPISVSAPCSLLGPVISAWWASAISICAPELAELREPLEPVLEDRLVDARGARWPGSAGRRPAAGGRSRGPG